MDSFNKKLDETKNTIIRLFKSKYLDPQGCPYYAINGKNGAPIGNRNLLSELDDYVPFFWMLDEKQFVLNQIRILEQTFKKNKLIFMKPQIRQSKGIGLPAGCRKWVRHVDSQDYVEILYGLLELYELSGTEKFLHLATAIMDMVLKKFYRLGFVRTWRIRPFGPTLSVADALSGMYIEIAADLARLTNKHKYLVAAEEMARSWTRTSLFEEYGIFPSVHLEWPWNKLPYFKRYRFRTELAKSNTSPAYGLVALTSPPHSRDWAMKALDQWVDGLYNHFSTKKLVLAHTPRLHVTDPYGDILSTNFAVLDILCDLYNLKPEKKFLDLAVNIARYFLEAQSSKTGLFPDKPGFCLSYLDANTDIAVSLKKLYEITGTQDYLDAGENALMGVLKYHQNPYGFWRDVDLETGDALSEEIETRFVSLLLKPLILYSKDVKVFGEGGYWSLFRDR